MWAHSEFISESWRIRWKSPSFQNNILLKHMSWGLLERNTWDRQSPPTILQQLLHRELLLEVYSYIPFKSLWIGHRTAVISIPIFLIQLVTQTTVKNSECLENRILWKHIECTHIMQYQLKAGHFIHTHYCVLAEKKKKTKHNFIAAPKTQFLMFQQYIQDGL